jgi:hypothetical protein
LDEDIFKDKVGGQSVKQLGRVAKERRSGSMVYAEAMILAYNGKKKSMHHRLAMNKLYAKDFTIVSDDDFGDDDFFDNIDDDDMELYEGEDEE